VVQCKKVVASYMRSSVKTPTKSGNSGQQASQLPAAAAIGRGWVIVENTLLLADYCHVTLYQREIYRISPKQMATVAKNAFCR